jgi:hypothetical protein
MTTILTVLIESNLCRVRWIILSLSSKIPRIFNSCQENDILSFEKRFVSIIVVHPSWIWRCFISKNILALFQPVLLIKSIRSDGTRASTWYLEPSKHSAILISPLSQSKFNIHQTSFNKIFGISFECQALLFSHDIHRKPRLNFELIT